MTELLWFLPLTACPAVFSAALTRWYAWFGASWNFYFGWVAGGCGGTAGLIFCREWLLAAASLPTIAVAVILWWLSRRRRRRAPRAYGTKSRARIAALVRRARSAARPGRVLRPAPGPA